MSNLIISLNYNPGHYSHLIANYKLNQLSSRKSILLVHSKFYSMDTKNEYEKIDSIRKLFFEVKNIESAVFWFPSLLNTVIVLLLKARFGAKCVFVFHEPFESVWDYYSAGFSVLKILKIWLINLVNLITVFFSDKIILSSNKALSIYKEKYLAINSNILYRPLIFDDEMSIKHELVEKKYISYIGTIAKDHAFSCFVNYACSEEGSIYNFLIATSSNVPIQEMKRLLQTGRVEIINGKPMTNDEINIYYSQSLVVWNAYHRSMQSGVLPKAFMFGAAVLVLRKNSNEFIENNKTGILINDNNDKNEISNAINEIHLRRHEFYINCRAKFLTTFYYDDLEAKNEESFCRF